MAYGDFKDLPRRAVSDRIFCDKTFNLPKNWKFDEYRRDLASMIYNFFDYVKSAVSSRTTQTNY